MHRFLMTISALTVSVGLLAQVKVAKPEDHGMDPERLARVDAVIDDAIRAGTFPVPSFPWCAGTTSFI